MSTADWKKYKLTDNDTGLSVEVPLPEPPTPEQAQQYLNEYQVRSTDNLRKGIPVKEIQVVNPQPSYYGVNPSYSQTVKTVDKETWYTQNVAGSLGVPRSDFVYGESAPFSVRTKLDFLRNKSERVEKLKEYYGNENVTMRNVEGDERIFWRGEDNKWRFYDGEHFEPAKDLIADAAGDFIPISAGILSSILAYGAQGGPAGSGFTGGGNIYTSAAIGVGTEATVGTAQDSLARWMFDLDLNFGEILLHRGKEAAFNMLFEFGILKGSRNLGRLMVNKNGANQMAEDGIALAQKMEGKDDIPTMIRLGDDPKSKNNVLRMKDIATNYPNSAAAQYLNRMRGFGANEIALEFGLNKLTKDASDDIMKVSLKNMTEQFTKEINVIDNALKETDKLIKEAKDITESSLKRTARKEANEIYEKELSNKIKSFSVEHVSPEQAGLNIQNLQARNYINLQIAKNNKYDIAYDLLEQGNVKVDVSRIADAFSNVRNEATETLEGEIISVIASQTQREADRVIKGLSDLSGETLSFRQLNDLLRDVNARAKNGQGVGSVTGDQYKVIAKELQAIKDEVLRSAGPQARKAFNDADDFYKNVILPEEEITKTSLKLMPGQNWTNAIRLASEGKNYKMPTFVAGGSEVIASMFTSPKKLQDFLNASGNTTEARNLARQYFLSSKGIVKGSPINRANLKLSDKDIDLANILFPGQNGSYSARVNKLIEASNFAKDKGDFIDGVTADTYDKLFLEAADTNPNIQKLLEEEIALKSQRKELEGNKLIKLMNKGELPLPENQVMIEGFVDSMMSKSTSVADIKDFMKLLGEKHPERIDSFRLSLYNHLVKRSRGGLETFSQKFDGDTLWNPKLFDDALRKNEDKYVAILGKEKYDNISRLNRGLDVASVGRKGDDEVNAAIAFGGSGKPSGFISGLGDEVRNRYTSLMINADINIPQGWKMTLTEMEYDDLMRKWAGVSLLGSRGMRLFTDQADADPAFMKEMYLTNAEINSLRDRDR